MVPIILISLFAIAFGGMSSQKDSDPVYLPVSDLDNSSESRQIIGGLDSLSSLSTEIIPLPEALEKISRGKMTAVLIFHKGFADSVASGGKLPLELRYDQAHEVEVGILQSVLMGQLYAGSAALQIRDRIARQIQGKYSNLTPEQMNVILQDVDAWFSEDSGKGESGSRAISILKMTPVIGETDDRNLGLIQAVSGTTIMMLLFSVTGIGAGILVERDMGTLKRLLYSPIPPVHILFGKMIAGNVIAVMQLILMFLFTWLVFGLNIWQDIPSLIFMIIATAFACSSFGIFLASVSRTVKQVESMSTVIILVMSAIGGSMIPLFIMPEFMKRIAVVSVNYWSIQGFYDIFWRQLPVSEVLVRVFVLLSIGMVMTVISIVFYRKNILKLIG